VSFVEAIVHSNSRWSAKREWAVPDTFSLKGAQGNPLPLVIAFRIVVECSNTSPQEQIETQSIAEGTSDIVDFDEVIFQASGEFQNIVTEAQVARVPLRILGSRILSFQTHVGKMNGYGRVISKKVPTGQTQGELRLLQFHVVNEAARCSSATTNISEVIGCTYFPPEVPYVLGL
jgi:hypothetical protein